MRTAGFSVDEVLLLSSVGLDWRSDCHMVLDFDWVLLWEE